LEILAPLDHVEEVEGLIKAGANELYCGLFWEKWSEKYTIAAINRRPGRICNLKTFGQLRQITNIAHHSNVSVALTINEHYYLEEQYSLLWEYINRALDAGVDSFIIADSALISALK
jgi:collagenase-like PrtC family protease